MEAYRLAPMLQNERVSILADESTDLTVFGQGRTRQIEISCEEAPPWLLKGMIARWAVGGLSTNGRTMKKHIDMVIKAAEGLGERSRGTAGGR